VQVELAGVGSQKDIELYVFHRVKSMTIVFPDMVVGRHGREFCLTKDAGHIGDQYPINTMAIPDVEEKAAGAFCMTRVMQHHDLHITQLYEVLFMQASIG